MYHLLEGEFLTHTQVTTKHLNNTVRKYLFTVVKLGIGFYINLVLSLYQMDLEGRTFFFKKSKEYRTWHNCPRCSFKSYRLSDLVIYFLTPRDTSN